MSATLSTVTRYALTHINTSGVRQLTSANQGRNHFDTLEQANAHLAAFLANNSESRLREVFGPFAVGTFAIRPVECYGPGGDAVGVYFGRYMPLESPNGNGWQVFDTEATRFLDGTSYPDLAACVEACKGWNGESTVNT